MHDDQQPKRQRRPDEDQPFRMLRILVHHGQVIEERTGSFLESDSMLP